MKETTSPAVSGRTTKSALAVALIASLFAITKMECAKPREPSYGQNTPAKDSSELARKAWANYYATHFRFP